ncbi:prepilin peptidase [Pseudomethylobacillus aquaticus]|uniref:Prepilin leader peptidase/N-methyltransferase n=1 Tax=Pseudomethylobacillus aquaticus TaxID=2676064 RepID=A0A3N0V0M1_9PROT|nr:A24 family peptidase [Pseudomethylobacillus aquaticus]ROH86347.1 prepilin peptidase [Pseudomethylobacillus aquaticus]
MPFASYAQLVSDLNTHLPALLLISGLIGLLVGSFLNVVIHRLPRMMELEWQASNSDTPPVRYNLLRPRSSCPQCQQQLSIADNIPLLSYALLRGRCRYCQHPIAARYPLVEACTGILTAVVAWQFGWGWQMLTAWLFLWALIALTFIDLDTYLLPDSITLPLLWLGLLINLGGSGYTDLHSAVIGAAAGYLSLWSVYWLFKLIRGKEGMGYGDFKLCAAIGAWFGWQVLPAVILLSSLIGAVVGILLLVTSRQNSQTPIAFGPYLALAGLATLLWSDTLAMLGY